MGDMDSGNSGSIQSSSTGGGGGAGDEQEYESHAGRGETTSFPASIWNNNPTVNYQVAPIDNARLIQLYSLNNGSSSSLNNIFDNHQLQFGSLESVNTITTTPKVNPAFESNNNLDSIIWADNKFGPIDSTHGYSDLRQPHIEPPPPLSENSPRASNPNASGGPGRNPKKRSRASRRAPTTVLTTDTSNFRQMVQEFTGIPTPPFSAFPTRSRLDLFSGMGSGMGQSSYLLRPFAQKLIPSSTNSPMLSFPSLVQQSSSSLIHEGSNGTGSDRHNWAGLSQGLGLTRTNEGASVPTVTNTGNNSERVGDVTNSISDNHGAGGGMVADSWICSSD